MQNRIVRAAYLAVALVAVNVVLLACGGGTQTTPGQAQQDKVVTPSKTAFDWSKAGNTETVGEVSVTMPFAVVGPVWGKGRHAGPTFLYVKVQIKNTSTTRLVRWTSWYDRHGTCLDEHGNSYKGIRFRGNMFATAPRRPDGTFDPDVKKAPIYVESADLQPGTSHTSYIFYEAPVDAARQARLVLPADSFEGQTGELHFKLPITRMKP